MGKYYAVLLVAAIAGSQIALVGIIWPEFAGVTAADSDLQERLRSVLVRRDEIFVSCPKGLYHTLKSEKQWVPLSIEDRIPLDGYFAAQSPTSSSIYYFTPRWIGWKIPSINNKTFGLYRFDLAGKKWKLLSAEHDFVHIFIHDDGVIYGITNLTHYNRILMSVDSGEHWQDISNGIGKGIQLLRIFQDPDHKELVCLSANCIRGLVLHANDKNYEWKITKEWDWWRPRETDDLFFAPSYSTGSSLYMHAATLSNYFDYPFGSRTQMPSFQIAIGRSYAFKQHEKMVLPFEIRFLDNVGTAVTLLDMEGETAFWGLRRILPDGKREFVWPARVGSRESRTLKSHVLNKKQPYARSLDISALCEFSKLGTYRVQLIYDSGWLADRTKGEWPGSFCSPVFELKVTE